MITPPDISYDSPCLPVDLAIDGAIWPCGECQPWHVEIITRECGHTFAREWHACECPLLVDLLSDEDDDDSPTPSGTGQ